jgi:methionyl-tRNA formyltransferase
MKSIKKTLIITDNSSTLSFALDLKIAFGEIDIFQSPPATIVGLPVIDIGSSHDLIISNYNLVLSLHSKQIFPKKLLAQVRCVNIHPGYNPYNRGWFPHVFSIINGMKAGVTIHEMDEEIDHGGIIIQEEYDITPWDTSESAYENILKIEEKLLFRWYPKIRDHDYTTYLPQNEGNINYKKDYEELKRLDLNKTGSFHEFLRLLRALSHGSYENAYFIDGKGQRIYVRVILEMENR